MNSRVRTIACALLLAATNAQAASQCYGKVADGRLEGAVKLPLAGPNFSTYSIIAAGAGRTNVHSTVADIVLDAYGGLAKAVPHARFVYGETGLASGGSMRTTTAPARRSTS